MPKKVPYFIICIVLALALCIAHVLGSTVLILGCLAVFLLLVGFACLKNHTLPVMLFFLPWSPILRTSVDSFSFYTFALVLICLVSILKKRFRFKRYHIVAGILLVGLTLTSKLLEGNSLSFDYFAFMMLIVLFPVVKEEWTGKQYDFYQVVTYFSAGIIIAALCAMQFATYPTIASFIQVDTYLTVIRRCGFYGDANFYTAQITAAMAGCFSMLLKQNQKRRVAFLGILLVLMIYCGFLSGSKSFVLVASILLLLWLITFIRMRGRAALKVIVLVALALLTVYVLTSTLFKGLLEVIAWRFSNTSDLDSFTTGRTQLWNSYVTAILKDAKLFFLGKGFSNVKLNDRGSHSTPIQSIYQFGVVGLPILLFWIVCFFRDTSRVGITGKRFTLNLLMVIVGVLLPWIAIDILFFDDFFLLQWYLFIAMQQPQLRGWSNDEIQINAPDDQDAEDINGSDGGNSNG